MFNLQSSNPFTPCPSKRGRFINPHVDSIKRTLWDAFLWQLGFYNDDFELEEKPEDFSYPNPMEKVSLDKPTAMWINHSTFYVCIENIHIVTDPIWSKRCSPFSFLGPKRLHEPPCEVSDLPPIDLVVLSHDHYDHFDKKTLLEIIQRNPRVTFLVPKGVKKRVEALGAFSVIELSWGESRKIGFLKNPGLTIDCTLVPSQHFSGRTLFDKNKTLWGGWVLNFLKDRQPFKQLYFVGDTGYNSRDFVQIGEVFGGFDLSLIPIGTYVPEAFMSPVHINPSNAVRIHKEVKSKLSLAMHWHTFRLSSEKQHQPPYDLFLAMEKEKLDPMTFRVVQPGQRINW